MHCILSQARIREHMTPQEILASLLAAIAHDMDHPGVNQPFLIATSNHLAALYRNTSVLENHHWRSAISCLIESDVLGEGSALQAPLEAQISSLILATDITRQQEYLSRFKGHLDTNTLDMTKKEHRHLVLQIALKCADISNPCRPWEISRKWSLKVCEEFFRQGDYERQLNLPVTPLCDRYNTSIPKIQTGFFMYVVTPLISEWHRFLHNDLSTQMLKNLLYNQKKWESLLEQEEAEENGTEIPIPEDETPEEESEPALSDSSEMLLPRRSSLNPTQVKQNGLKDQLRRFSVPLNMRSEKLKRGSLAAAEGITPCESEHSLHCDASDKVEKVLSTENLLPNTTIASITTPKQATRLNTVFKDGCTWKLVRQQTFPPLDPHARLHGYFSREHQDKSDEPVLCSRFRSEAWLNDGKTDGKSDDRLKEFKKKETEKTVSDGSPTNGTSSAEASPARRKENWIPIVKPLGAIRRESAVGSQLRDNITSFQLGAPYDALCRRKSMPADTITLPATLKDSLMCEMAEVLSLPQFLRRTLSNKDALTRRRGSAPAPIAVSDLGLLALASRSSNGGRRKPPVGPVGPVACQVWASRGAGGYPPERVPRLPRRSSLPVEVLTGI
ncbi:dual specificity calcium/calmodulin-dependent 3',5'-cyclic nucleotide phosphodiesterase 1C-like isoform X2 [Ostrinia nubilalis]|uniref:dual specificity calcium/calmodulin-dependent 3',5'-cyclic nucleotide phosphodiesterase 1C-like isoform X2 n=1 Tax=Ostrinia nubilalis TaxID=29057 RepID=UPI0030826617